jgi:hypothetical protein
VGRGALEACIVAAVTLTGLGLTVASLGAL